MTTRRTTIHSLLAALTLALAGCDASLPWSTPKVPATKTPATTAQSPGPITPAALTFRGWLHGPAPTPQSVAVAALLPGMLVSFDATPPAVKASVDYADTSAAITMILPDDAGVGTHHGFVTVSAGWSGGQAMVGSPWTVPCTYVVGPPALEGLPASLTVDQFITGPATDPTPLQLAGAADAGPWTVTVESGWGIPTWLRAVPSGGSGVPAVVSLEVIGAPSSAIAPDTATVVVRRAGQQVRIPVTRPIRYPGLRVDATPIALSIEADQAERPSFAVQVDTDAGAVATGIVDVVYDPPIAWGDVSWLSFSWQILAPQRVPFQLSTTALAPGHYTATLTFTAEQGGASQAVQVTLDVSAPPATIAPTALTYQLGASATAASLQQQLVLTSLGDAVDWTASADVPWLRVTPAGSTAPGGASTIAVEVVPEALETLRCRYGSGGVTVSASARGGRAYTYRAAVSLELELPCLIGLGPSVDVEGNGAPVAFVGRNLGSAPQALFGEVAVPIDPALEHWGELRVAPPPLPPGTYRATIPTALGFAIGSATYRVAPAQVPAAAAIAAPGRKVRLVFDDATRWLWAINTGLAVVERWDAAAGWARQAMATPGLQDAVLLPGGATWLSLVGAEFSTFEASAFPSAAPVSWGSAQAGPGTLAAPLDGHVLLTADPATCTYSSCITTAWDPVTRMPMEFGIEPGARLGASRSGLRIGIGDDSGLRYAVEYWWAGYMASGAGGWYPLGDFTGMASSSVDPQLLALDRHGDRVLLLSDGTRGLAGSQLLDAAGQVVPGKLPPTIANAVLTQGGERAVAFDGPSRTIRIFDLTGTPDPVSGLFPEVGTAGGFAPLADPGAAVVMALSADDRTLFIAGDDRVLVVPLP